VDVADQRSLHIADFQRPAASPLHVHRRDRKRRSWL
jgi:hypothetical protein